jgi:hypothetical protein
MTWTYRTTMVAGAVMVAVLASGCVAPDIEVIGAVGVTVDEEARPVLVIEACEGAASAVTLSFNREGLADDEENEQIATWTAVNPAAGTSSLALHAPSAPWQGAGIDLPVERGYVAGGAGADDRQVLTQVAFSGSQLAGMEPGTVYRNEPDPDSTTLVASTPADFSAEVCSRG